MKKGQLTVEITVLLAVLLLVMVVLFVLFAQRVEVFREVVAFEEQQFETNALALRIAHVDLLGSDVSKQLFVSYTTQLFEKSIIVNSSRFTTQSLSHTILIPQNITGLQTIRSQNGVIFFD